MNIGQRVREAREDLGMQRTVLARRVGVAENTIYRIETAKRMPSVELLEKIARELRTEPAEFLREPAPLDSALSAPVSMGGPSVDLQEARLIKKDLEASERARETVAHAREQFALTNAEAEVLRQYVAGYQDPKPQPFAVVELLPEDGSPGVDHDKIRGVLQQMIERDELDPEQLKAVALSLIAS
jgi:transcriptional regulator with XRE-family HTH domain